MSLFVKICGLRDAAAVEAAVESGADALGFVFAQSPRRVDPRTAALLTRHVPATIARFAVTRHPDAEQLSAVFSDFSPDYLQTDAEDFASIRLPAGCRALPVYREGGAAPPPGQRILFEGADSGTGRAVDWGQARALAQRCELILAGGLDVDNVATAIAEVQPWGVDVSSGVEQQRGIKDPGKIRAFIARVRAQEKTGDQRRK